VAIKQFLTTGEVAKLLGISRSTVTRKFDQNILKGKKNPITGERLIGRDSLEDFVAQYDMKLEDMSVGSYSVILATADPKLVDLAERVFANERRIDLEHVQFGCDALMLCSRRDIDLLIIDEEIADIAASDVIKSIRRIGEPTGIKILSIGRPETVQLSKEWGADEAIPKEQLDPLRLTQRIIALLNLAEAASAAPEDFTHQRRHRRASVSIPAGLSVVRRSTATETAIGKTLIRNISEGGAFLQDIVLTRGTIPTESFMFRINVSQDPLKNLNANCRVVRMKSNGGLTAGVEFVDLAPPDTQNIAQLVH